MGVWGFEFSFQGVGSRVEGLGLRVHGSGFRVQGAGSRVEGLDPVSRRLCFENAHPLGPP